MCECCGGDCRLWGDNMSEQPLNEAYSNEVLEAYQEISHAFNNFTNLINQRIPYEQWPESLQIAGVSEDLLGAATGDPVNMLFSKLQDMGRVEEKLLNLLEDEIFQDTSKHNTFWHSKHGVEADKLDDLRGKISCLHDNLWDIIAILRRHEDNEES